MTKRELKAYRAFNYLGSLCFEAMFSFFFVILIGKTSEFTTIGNLISMLSYATFGLLCHLIDKMAVRRSLNKFPLLGKNGEAVYYYCIHVSLGDKVIHETILCSPKKLPYMVEETKKKLAKPESGKKYHIKYGRCKKCKFATCDDPKKRP